MNLENPSIKTKIKAFHQFEALIGKPKSVLNAEERTTRNENVRRILNLPNKEVQNFDLVTIKNAVDNFFLKHSLPNNIQKIVIQPLKSGMIMKVLDDTTLILEEAMCKTQTPEFSSLMVVHEMYHKYVQNMEPNMKDIKYYQDYFGQQTIVEMDIDADIETFMLAEKQGTLDFEKYLTAIHKGLSYSKDERPRIFKIARFLGSLISIKATLSNNKKLIGFPYLNEINKNKLYFAIISDGRKYANLEVEYEKTKQVIDLYQNAENYSVDEFVNLLESYCTKVAQQLE